MIIRELLENPTDAKEIIYDFFHSDLPRSFWGDVRDTPRQYLFESVAGGVLVLAIIVRSGAGTATILAIVLSFIIAWFILARKNTIESTKKDDNTMKLRRLNRAMKEKRNIFDLSARSILHKNPALVDVLSSMFVFARFDDRTFRDALIKANQLVRVYESVKLKTVLPSQYLEIAEQLSRDVLNNMQGMIHSLPSTSVGGFRFQVSLEILQEVLQKITDDIRLIVDNHYREVGPDIYNPPPSTRSGPWPDPTGEKSYNPHFNFY